MNDIQYQVVEAHIAHEINDFGYAIIQYNLRTYMRHVIKNIPCAENLESDLERLANCLWKMCDYLVSTNSKHWGHNIDWLCWNMRCSAYDLESVAFN